MEERKIHVEVQKRSVPGQVTKMDSKEADFSKADEEVSKVLGDGGNDNWFELRFLATGPDRRGYHSSFIHNRR